MTARCFHYWMPRAARQLYHNPTQLNEGQKSDLRSTVHVVGRHGLAVRLLDALVVVVGDELLEPLYHAVLLTKSAPCGARAIA